MTTPTSSSKALTLAKFFGAGLIGFAGGIAVTIFVVSYFSSKPKGTQVWVANEVIHAEGILIPAGTQLIHDGSMSEGFDRLALYLNVDATESDKFKTHQDPHSGLVIPYWIGPYPAQKTQ